MHFVSVYVVYPYSSIDTVTAWKESHFILSDRSDFYMIDNLFIAVHTFTRCMLASLPVDEILLLRYVNFRGLVLRVEIVPTLFYLQSQGGQCLLLFALGYAVGIHLGLVYLLEVLYHLHNLCLS